MDDDKSQDLGSINAFHADFSHSWDALDMTSGPPLLGHASGSGPDAGHFSHDLSRMTDNPSRNLGHRRAHSEILHILPDDLSFDMAIGVGDGRPSLSDEVEDDLLSIYLEMDKLDSSTMSMLEAGGNSTSATGGPATAEPIFGYGMAIGSGSLETLAATGPSRVIRHRHSHSMDGMTSIQHEMLMSGPYQGPSSSRKELKKAMSTTKLAELALVDPKRAKRIWANRQSAARSRQRKMRYIGELEQKLQALKIEAASLSAQRALLEQNTNDLTAENSELKLRLQTTEQQVHLQDALNDALKEEIVHLKVQTGQAMPDGGSMMNFPAYKSGHQFDPNNHAMHALLTTQQFQQLQIHPQTHQQQQQQQHQRQQQ